MNPPTQSNATHTLIAAKIHSGFSGTDHSAVKVDLLFSGHIPQAELLHLIKTALANHEALAGFADRAYEWLKDDSMHADLAKHAKRCMDDLNAPQS